MMLSVEMASTKRLFVATLARTKFTLRTSLHLPRRCLSRSLHLSFLFSSKCACPSRLGSFQNISKAVADDSFCTILEPQTSLKSSCSAVHYLAVVRFDHLQFECERYSFRSRSFILSSVRPSVRSLLSYCPLQRRRLERTST